MFRVCFAFLTLVAVLLIGYLWEGGIVVVLLHPLIPTLVLVTCSVALVLGVLFPAATLRRAVGDVALLSAPSPASLVVWRFAERASYLAGVVAMLLGLIITSRFMDQTGNLIGAKVGACFTALVVGLLQGLFASMLRARVELGLSGASS
jgi:hypothetical protein